MTLYVEGIVLIRNEKGGVAAKVHVAEEGFIDVQLSNVTSVRYSHWGHVDVEVGLLRADGDLISTGASLPWTDEFAPSADIPSRALDDILQQAHEKMWSIVQGSPLSYVWLDSSATLTPDTEWECEAEPEPEPDPEPTPYQLDSKTAAVIDEIVGEAMRVFMKDTSAYTGTYVLTEHDKVLVGRAFSYEVTEERLTQIQTECSNYIACAMEFIIK